MDHPSMDARTATSATIKTIARWRRADGSGANKRRRRSAAAADGLTALPLDVRGRIASFLPYREAVRLSTLSRAWRGIHHRALVVSADLRDFLAFDEEGGDPDGVLNDDALLGLRRALEGSRVAVLRLCFSVLDARMKRHADSIVALADAPTIELTVPFAGAASRAEPSPWEVVLPPTASELGIFSHDTLAVTIAGAGAAALVDLYLDTCVLREWPRLPALRHLTLRFVRVTAPFAPGAHSPQLEQLVVWNTRLERAGVDIHLPALKTLVLDDVDIYPVDYADGPFGDVTIDAPLLEELEVNCAAGCIAELRSFTLRAPRLWHLSWFGQFTERVRIDAGSVSDGTIEFMSNGEREKEMIFHVMEEYKDQMTRMLRGLLPHLPPERIAAVAEPCMRVDKSTMEEEHTGEMIPLETLTCDLNALMSSQDI